MTTTAERIRAYAGLALFSYGFRPFFLGAAIWAALSMAIWLAMLFDALLLPTLFTLVDWHIHELLYGYLPAVIAGFLLTAVPNWTGRLPVTGLPLAALFLVWLAGRVAIFASASIGAWPAAIIDGSFLILLAAVVAREIIAGSNTRNLKVLVLILLVAFGNMTFHAEAAMNGTADVGRRLGIAAILLLIMVIGGRIVPSFTRNWLARRAAGVMPVTFNRFDIAAIAIGVAVLVPWVIAPDHPVLAPAALAAAIIHGVRLARWAGHRTFAEPMVLVLHAAYGFIPIGFLLLGLSIATPQVVSSGAAAHAWTVGAMALMTLAVMTRASLGHTGHPLTATPAIAAIYFAAGLAALSRVAATFDVAGPALLHVSAVMWLAAFAGFAVVFGPMLWRPRAG